MGETPMGKIIIGSPAAYTPLAARSTKALAGVGPFAGVVSTVRNLSSRTARIRACCKRSE